MNRLLLFLFPIVLSSCNCIYQIKINQDGSAHVDQQFFCLYEEDILEKDSSLVDESKKVGGEPKGANLTSEETIQHFLNSQIIHNYKWTSSKETLLDAKYDIDHIDSLGSYIDGYYNWVNPIFSFSKKQFKISCPPGNKESFIDENTFGAVFVELIFKFPSKIESISCNNEKVTYSASKKGLHLKFRLEELYLAKTDTEVLVLFK
jgi:hypothetical protein